MVQVNTRESADRDLTAIWVWYVDHAGYEIADRFLEAVTQTLAVVGQSPDIGARIGKHGAGLRRIPVGNGFGKYLLIYVRADGGIDLVRVLHGSRDLEALGLLKHAPGESTVTE